MSRIITTHRLAEFIGRAGIAGSPEPLAFLGRVGFLIAMAGQRQHGAAAVAQD